VKTCPFCDAGIRETAIICRFCSRSLITGRAASVERRRKPRDLFEDAQAWSWDNTSFGLDLASVAFLAALVWFDLR
jgi:hypothetical protein